MKACPFCAEEIQDAAIVCKHCGRDLKAGATQVQLVTPKKKTSVAAWGCLIVLIIVAFLLLIGSLVGPPSNERAAVRLPTRGDSPTILIAEFGAPDFDTNNEQEVPRPPIVTRMLTYQTANVRAIYVADAKFGDAPPYKGWRLVGFTDPRTNASLSVALAVVRLKDAR